MGLSLVRYYDFDDPPDVDPLTTQPAADAYGPLLTAKGGRVLVNAWVVNDEGRRVSPPPPVNFDLAIVTLNKVTCARPSSATATDQVTSTFWGRGALSLGITPGGIWQIQTELGAVVGFTVLVVGVTTSAPGLQLAIFADLDPRGRV